MSSLIISDAVDLLPQRRGPGHSHDGNAVRFSPLIYLAAPITVYGTEPYNTALTYGADNWQRHAVVVNHITGEMSVLLASNAGEVA